MSFFKSNTDSPRKGCLPIDQTITRHLLVLIAGQPAEPLLPDQVLGADETR